MIGFIVVMFVAFGAIGFLAVRLGQARQRLAALDLEISRLGRDLELEDREFESLLAEIGGSRIIVELTRPMALAREHSRWVGALSGVAPRLIRRRVYDEVAAQMKEVLTERGVAAEVRVFRPSGS